MFLVEGDAYTDSAETRRWFADNLSELKFDVREIKESRHELPTLNPSLVASYFKEFLQQLDQTM